jgi:hypothetical protein
MASAKRAGAPAVEAYPLDGDLTPSASGTGYASAFLRAGFKIVTRRVPSRPIMRHDLKSGDARLRRSQVAIRSAASAQ